MLTILTTLLFLGTCACVFEATHRKYCEVANVDKLRMIALRHYELVTIILCGVNAWFVSPSSASIVRGLFCVNAMCLAHGVRGKIMGDGNSSLILWPIAAWVFVSWSFQILL